MLFTSGVDPFEELLSVDAVTTTRGEWRPLAMVRQTLTVFLNTQIISTAVTKEAYDCSDNNVFSFEYGDAGNGEPKIQADSASATARAIDTAETEAAGKYQEQVWIDRKANPDEQN